MDKNKLIAVLSIITGALLVLLILFNNSLSTSMLAIGSILFGLASSAFLYLYIVQKSRTSQKSKLLIAVFFITTITFIILPLIKKFL
jgi:hypothetical protein